MAVERPRPQVSEREIREVVDSSRGVQDVVRQMFEFSPQARFSDVELRGRALLQSIHEGEKSVTVVTLPAGSKHPIGRGFEGEVFPYKNAEGVLEVSRGTREEPVSAYRGLTDGRRLSPGESYSIRSLKKAATFILVRQASN